MVIYVSKPDLKKLFSVFPEEFKKNKEARAGFIYEFTEGRCSSTAELTQQEAQLLIYSLEGNFTYYAKFDFSNTQHRYILSLCYSLGWTVFSQKQSKVVADLSALGKWLASKKSPVRKPLLEMTEKECSKIISALENILNK